jgi:hypothetical protein
VKQNSHLLGTYYGQVQKDKCSGWGFNKWTKSRDEFFGSWQDNQMHGYGVYNWGTGRSYDGMYKEGK